jgi:hypothetical protein
MMGTCILIMLSKTRLGNIYFFSFFLSLFAIILQKLANNLIISDTNR